VMPPIPAEQMVDGAIVSVCFANRSSAPPTLVNVLIAHDEGENVN